MTNSQLQDHTSGPRSLTTGVGSADADTVALRLARRSIRGQIARLDRQLCTLVTSEFPHARPTPAAALHGGPRLLTLAELERSRDDLVRRIAEVRAQAARRAESVGRARALLEQARRDPRSYKSLRLTAEQVGEPGCGVWEVRPRLGLIGILAGWWELTVSSGCPLATGRRGRRRPARQPRGAPPVPGWARARRTASPSDRRTA